MKDELSAGLNMLNTTNLDYFGAHHQAEIFRLKGVFLQVGRVSVVFLGGLGCWYMCSVSLTQFHHQPQSALPTSNNQLATPTD